MNGRHGGHTLRTKGTNMKLRIWTIAIVAGSLLIPSPASGAAAQTQAPDTTNEKAYDASMPREQQIALALSAAPAEVSGNATVYILGPQGYEKVRQGTNGFSCIVGRSFAKPTETTIAPMCYDAEGSRTLLLVSLRTEELRAAGKSEAEIKADIANGYKDGRFKAPAKPGFLYMMSSKNRLGPDPKTGETVGFPPHVMFYAPYMTAKDLGYSQQELDANPYMGLANPGEPDALIVVIPAR
jgi:hypothetical protein